MGYCSLPLGGAKLELWMGSADKGLITISVLCKIQWTHIIEDTACVGSGPGRYLKKP